MKKYITISILLFWSFYSLNLNACSIFCASNESISLMAGNEDWSDPFTQIWVQQKSEKNYGVLYIGHSNFQIQLGVNEFGLALDFAAMPEALGKNLEGKIALGNNLFVEILSKCKDVEEALIFLNKYEYPSPFHQVLISDASGNSLTANQDGIVKKSEAYQIITNFNSCNPDLKTSCERFGILEDSFVADERISIDQFKSLLSRVHQEGSHPTQYSYIIDQKKENIHLFSFHGYSDELVFNFKDLIRQGTMLKAFKELFPTSFAEQEFRTQHKDALKQSLIEKLRETDAKTVLNDYKKLVDSNPETANYPFLIIDIAISIISEVGTIENEGYPFDYWWQPSQYFNFESENPLLKKALVLLNYLEQLPKEDPKQNIGAYEFKGVIYAFLNNRVAAKEYFQKTLEISPKDIGNYRRSSLFLEHLNSNP